MSLPRYCPKCRERMLDIHPLEWEKGKICINCGYKEVEDSERGKCALAVIFGDKWCYGGNKTDPLCAECPLLKEVKR